MRADPARVALRLDGQAETPGDASLYAGFDGDAELSDFFDHASIGLHWVGPDGVILRANRAELQMLGYTNHEYVGRNIADFYADAAVIEDVFARLKRHEVLHDYEARLVHKDGSIIDVLVDSTVIWHEGEFIHTRCFTRNNTAQRRQRIEEARLAELRHNDLYQDAPDMLMSIDVATASYVAVNDTFVNVTGYSRQELMGKSIYDVYAPECHDAVRAAFARFLESGEVRDATLVLRRNDGSTLPVSLNVTAVRDEGGVIRYSRSVLRDVSDRERALAEKQRALSMFETLLTAAPVGFAVLDRDMRFIVVNQMAADMYGLPVEAHIGKRPDELAPLFESQVASLEHVLKTGEVVQRVEIRGEAPAHPGVERCWLVSYYPVLEGDTVSAVGVVVRDITDRKNAAAAMRRLASLLDLTHDAVIVRRLHDGEIQYWNPGAEQLYGWARSDADGQRTYDLLQTHHPRGAAYVDAELEAQGAWDGELVHVTRAGDRIIVESRQVVIGEGDALLVLETNRDITDRKHGERELRLSEARYRTLADSIPAMVTVTRPNGQVEYVSQSALAYTGLTEEEAFAGQWTKIVHPDDLVDHAPAWAARVRAGGHLKGEVRLRRHDGAYRWHYSSIAPVLDADGNVRLLVGAHIDIDDRKRAEQELEASLLEREESRALLDALLSTSPVGMGFWDRDLRFLRVNQALAEINGVPLEEHLGRTVEEIVPALWPVLEPMYHAALAGDSTIDVEVSGQTSKQPGETRYLLTSFYPVERADGYVMGVGAVVIEITERKEAEAHIARLYEDAKRTAEQLSKASAAKDEFLGLVSHELKTPITTIYGNAEVLRRRGDHIDGATRAGALRDIVHEAERLHRIVDNLLVLARLEHGEVVEPEPLLVARIAGRLIDDHQHRFPQRDVRLELTVPPTPVSGQPVYIEQVIRNLLSNAEKYSPAGRAIEVVITRDGRELCVSVRDHGPGFAADEEEMLFTPFYRSPAAAARASGFGIGLAVCKRLIEAQGGRMWAHRREEGGADIGFSLPLVEGDFDDDA